MSGVSRASGGGAPGYGVAAALGACAGLVWFAAASINVPLADIGEELGASANGLQWSVSAYLLALAGMLVVGGRAGDLFGRRRVLLIGLAHCHPRQAIPAGAARAPGDPAGRPRHAPAATAIGSRCR